MPKLFLFRLALCPRNSFRGSLIPRPTFVVGRVATQTASIGGKIVQCYSKMSDELRQNHYDVKETTNRHLVIRRLLTHISIKKGIEKEHHCTFIVLQRRFYKQYRVYWDRSTVNMEKHYVWLGQTQCFSILREIPALYFQFLDDSFYSVNDRCFVVSDSGKCR